MRLLFFPLQSAAPRTCRHPAVAPVRAWHQGQHHDACLKRRALQCSYRRSFSTSRRCCQHEIGKHRNHYENLNVPYDASPAEIKKAFYSLSKVHHPDRNRDDPSAASRFHSISEAYATLGTPAKRTAYDRDVLRSQQSQPGSGSGNATPRGSYHSAGGRPASGLSRRRTTFRGPPPSFFRNGGWGAQGHKRHAAHEDSTGTWSTSPNDGNSGGGGSNSNNPRDAGWTSGASAKAGMGPGQDPFGHTMDPNIPHFDSAGHHRTQRTQDHRRAQRVWREHNGRMRDKPSGAGAGAQESTASMFVTVSGVLFMTFFLPYCFFGGFRKKKKDDGEEDKSKKPGKKQQQQPPKDRQSPRKRQEAGNDAPKHLENDAQKATQTASPPSSLSPAATRDEGSSETVAIPVADKQPEEDRNSVA